MVKVYKETSDMQKEFDKITKCMSDIFKKKNQDYGNSFFESLDEDGLLVAKIRLKDKINRFTNLIKSDTINVSDESIGDTLVDLANYAILTKLWIDGNISIKC